MQGESILEHLFPFFILSFIFLNFEWFSDNIYPKLGWTSKSHTHKNIVLLVCGRESHAYQILLPCVSQPYAMKWIHLARLGKQNVSRSDMGHLPAETMKSPHIILQSPLPLAVTEESVCSRCL